MAYESADFAGTGIRIPRTAGTYSFLNVLLAPHSRGTVRLSSADPRAPLLVDPAYLSNPADLVPLRAALRLSLRLRDALRARGYALRDATVPAGERDADLDAWIRRANRTTYHYSSTCRMVPGHDKAAPSVFDKLRVHSVRGLRVADPSVFSDIVSVHLQAPTAMVGRNVRSLF